MTKIRVDTEILAKEAKNILNVSKVTISEGNDLLHITQSAPSYDGQFGPLVNSIGAEAFSKAKNININLNQIGGDLDIKSKQFLAADMFVDISLMGVVKRFPIPVIEARVQPWFPGQNGTIQLNDHGYSKRDASKKQKEKKYKIKSDYRDSCTETNQSKPPPRIYIINGINSTSWDGEKYKNPDKRMLGLQSALQLNYLGQVVVVDAIYNQRNNRKWKPVDWGGVGQTRNEFKNGIEGTESKDTYDFIMHDIKLHPLADGEEIIIIGHSGGGAVAANLAGMLENPTNGPGEQVQGIVTMGSPLVNVDAADDYAHVVQISENTDQLGLRGFKEGSTQYITNTNSGFGGEHNSYLDEGSSTIRDILKDEFYHYNAGLST